MNIFRLKKIILATFTIVSITSQVFGVELNQFIGTWTGTESLSSDFVDNYSNKPISIDISDAENREGFLSFLSSSEFIFNEDLIWAIHYFTYDKETHQIIFYKCFITPLGLLGNHELRYNILEINENLMVLDYSTQDNDTVHQIRVSRDALGVDSKSIASIFKLSQNYPNPFNPETAIQVNLPQDEFIQLEILDISGRIVNQLVKGIQSEGIHSFRWNGTNASGKSVSAGTYIYRLSSESGIESKKMILLK
ncbi:MAG: T9SS type A sorting domain-containing protein [Candidatus Marinimicrobia bacterium]|nr:T9SS type A sorting domain-containing protein [Candidatus Neomarinimicrobiota bacterium]MBT3937598.1 T9SS type A sorting domain-containing protein [Candidatus Neomarinimicrobiota bacterium]MBT3960695.1 T9SS type A sorting domain-containing protein [Candidatus Neomarinimicrobiota bacterium]MBT4382885.1 T9SS type A sorting domain-containing protein [Candidatus Neomarinimicrobiota bacterium]MBT4635085.1 T9SS type A sorting domain-containing protein [Candidatus Neomarinimicrobiota bacterium]